VFRGKEIQSPFLIGPDGPHKQKRLKKIISSRGCHVFDASCPLPMAPSEHKVQSKEFDFPVFRKPAK